MIKKWWYMQQVRCFLLNIPHQRPQDVTQEVRFDNLTEGQIGGAQHLESWKNSEEWSWSQPLTWHITLSFEKSRILKQKLLFGFWVIAGDPAFFYHQWSSTQKSGHLKTKLVFDLGVSGKITQVHRIRTGLPGTVLKIVVCNSLVAGKSKVQNLHCSVCSTDVTDFELKPWDYIFKSPLENIAII